MTRNKLHTCLAAAIFALTAVFALANGADEAQAAKKTKVVKVKKSKKKVKKAKKTKKVKKAKKTKKVKKAKKAKKVVIKKTAVKSTVAKPTTVKTTTVKTVSAKKTQVASANNIQAVQTPVGGDINGCFDTTDRAYTVDGETVVGHFDAEMSAELVTLLNQYRVSQGKEELLGSEVLTKAAVTRAGESTVSFSHTRPNGSSCFTVSQFASGENLASGYKTAAEFQSAWIRSATHNENMLRSEFKAVGIAVFAKQMNTYGRTYYSYYAVQIFGR